MSPHFHSSMYVEHSSSSIIAQAGEAPLFSLIKINRQPSGKEEFKSHCCPSLWLLCMSEFGDSNEAVLDKIDTMMNPSLVTLSGAPSNRSPPLRLS